jgi:hypothetical protein
MYVVNLLSAYFCNSGYYGYSYHYSTSGNGGVQIAYFCFSGNNGITFNNFTSLSYSVPFSVLLIMDVLLGIMLLIVVVCQFLFF